MSLVTVLWAMGAAAAVMLAIVYGATWILERRLVPNLFFCLTALAVAACARCELGMMHSATPAEFGEWMRWYHLPVFFVFLFQGLFVRFYLRGGRWWLLWTVLSLRLIIVIANFLVHPNVNFLEIDSLRHVPFLGEQVATLGDAVVRPGQSARLSTILLALVWLLDACYEAWRRRDPESRHKALVVFLSVLVPSLLSVGLTQLVLFGMPGLPYLDTPMFLVTLMLMALELSRDLMMSFRTRLELADLRANLVQVGRVSVLGQLASALTHELNQPLGAILRNTDVAELDLQTEKPDLDELRAIVADTGKSVRRAKEIIDGMRALIKRRSVEMRPLAVDDLVQDVMALARAETASKRVELSYVSEAGLPPVSGDRVHLSQVLLNLIVNGMEAVQECPPADRRVIIEARAEKGQVEMTVRDSGRGIPAAELERIFEPLFTTKSGGLGMGLAISRTIVEAHGGRLWAEHGPDGGAAFRFLLPQAKESVTSAWERTVAGASVNQIG
jgi:signal transduction histidine kinase